MQSLMDRFAKAASDFGLTISLKKTNVMAHEAEPPNITINGCQLEAVEHFTYLGSNITNNMSLDSDQDIRYGQASTTLARLSKRVWNSKKLNIRTKIAVYRACVPSTFLYILSYLFTDAPSIQKIIASYTYLWFVFSPAFLLEI